MKEISNEDMMAMHQLATLKMVTRLSQEFIQMIGVTTSGVIPPQMILEVAISTAITVCVNVIAMNNAGVHPNKMQAGTPEHDKFTKEVERVGNDEDTKRKLFEVIIAICTEIMERGTGKESGVRMNSGFSQDLDAELREKANEIARKYMPSEEGFNGAI